MAGPCPNGASTEQLHDQAKCRDRGRCTGPGCRVRRAAYVHTLPELDRAEVDALLSSVTE